MPATMLAVLATTGSTIARVARTVVSTPMVTTPVPRFPMAVSPDATEVVTLLAIRVFAWASVMPVASMLSSFWDVPRLNVSWTLKPLLKCMVWMLMLLVWLTNQRNPYPVRTLLARKAPAHTVMVACLPVRAACRPVIIDMLC